MATDWRSKSEAERKKLLGALRAREIARYRDSFEYWLFSGNVKTKDEHDATNPVKPFPDKPYLRFLAREWQHGPDIQFLAKSRQLLASWLMCAKTVWRTHYYPQQSVFFQSKKEHDAAVMIYDTTPQLARTSFIMSNLPDWMQGCVMADGSFKMYPLDQRTFTYGRFVLPNGSFAQALAQGAAQVESKVPSLFFSDEASLQDEWRLAHAALIPCISGGKSITVATMRMPSDYGHEISTCADVDPDGEMRGIARFTSRSGTPGIRLHYSSDPDKDPQTEKGKEWFARETSRMPGGYDGVEWQQHMEINPQSVTGQRCIPYWNEIKGRVVIDDLPYEQIAVWRVHAGADYGTRNPTVLLFLAMDYHGNAYFVDEISQPGLTVHELPGIDKGGVAGLAQLWKQHPLFHKVNGQIQMDPTTDHKTQNTANSGGLQSVTQLFQMNGVYLQPAKARGTEADDLALNWLHERWAGYDEPDWAPQLFIMRRCTGLINILAKAEYADWSPTAQQSNDLKPKMRPCVGMDSFDAAKHVIVALPQGPHRIKASPPVGSIAWIKARVKQGALQKSLVRS